MYYIFSISVSRLPLAVLLLAAPVTLVNSSWTHAQTGRTETIAQSGATVPGGNGTFNSFEIPVLNDAGWAGFQAALKGTTGGPNDNTGIYRGDGLNAVQIARKGQSVLGSGTIDQFGSNYSFNDSGAAAFFTTLSGTSGGSTDDTGIFRGVGGSIVQIAREGQSANGNGTFGLFHATSELNSSGAIAFEADLLGTSDFSGIFRGDGGAVSEIARINQAAPDGNGSFSNFDSTLSMNDSGAVAFRANLTGTTGGPFNDAIGLFRGSGGAITQIARAGSVPPDGNGKFKNFFFQDINESGTTAFLATLTNTTGGANDDSGIYRGSGGAITQIAREGQAIPAGPGAFSAFQQHSLNDSGSVLFSASLAGTIGGTSDNSGLFLGSGGTITQVARKGQVAPDQNGTFSSLLGAGFNNSSVAAFKASLIGTNAGTIDNQGLYLSDGIDLIQVARKGTMVGVSAIDAIEIDSARALNEYGQLAYRITLANGSQRIQRYTPDLHWRSTTGSTWDNSSRWTLGLNPGHVHDVYIETAASLTVSGPGENATVRRLQVGGGTGLATLSLRNGATLTAINGTTIESTGTLTGDGVIAGNVENYGNVIAQNVTFATKLTNHNVIRGNGRLDGTIINTSSGKIRALGGDTLWLSGSGFDNAGLIEVNHSELQIDAGFTNQENTGLISVRDGSLIADSGILNKGSIAVTLGNSTLHGDINNSGIIQVSGGAYATFFDDIMQNGLMQVSTIGSTVSSAVILGKFSGNGGFVGGGDVFALGDLRPGNSPASVLYDGNLFLGNSTGTFIELGGTGIGQFDQLRVTGDLNLAGDLIVSLIGGHTIGANQSYLIGDIGGNLFGSFNGLSEGDLVGNFAGQNLYISYAGGNGNDLVLFSAVPETCGLGMLSAIGACCLLNRRRHRHSIGLSCK